MASVTGEYDVATEVSIGLVNCVLAAIHENENRAYPRLCHSLTASVDDAYRGAADPIPESERTGIRTTVEVQLSTPTVSLPVDALADTLWSRSRQPVRTAARGGPLGPWGRPTCWPSISARLRLRAWLRDTPAELPEFVHGDLYLTAGLVRTVLWQWHPLPPRRRTFLGLDHSAGPEVRFEPAAGATLTDQQRVLVERIVRNAFRGDSEPVSVELQLPPEVHRFDYKLQPTGARPSAMLLFTLSDSPPGPQGPGSVGARFLPGGADFAVAVGRDYLLGLLRRELLGGLPPEYERSGTFWRVSLRPDWNGATFDLQPGRILFSISGDGRITYGVAPLSTTDDFSFTVRLAVTLQVVGGQVRPALVGDPEIELHGVFAFESLINDAARNAIKAGLQARLDPVPADLRDALDVGRYLKTMMSTLHPADPGVALTGVQIRADGVVVAGTVALAPSRPVTVRRADLNGRADALESWIPGGTIDRFVWDGHLEEHRFVTENPIAAIQGCLSVQGTRVTRGGGLVPVAAEDCPLVVALLPVLTGLPTPAVPCRRLLLPLLAGGPGEGVEVVGHYDPWASGLAPRQGPTNLLVHFAERPWAEAARTIAEALAATRHRDAALIVLGVLGPGELPRAATVALKGDATVLLAEDSTGSWADTFGTPKRPTTVLVGPNGAVRWKDQEALDPAKLARALDEHLEPGGKVAWWPLRLAVPTGGRAPDAPLRLGDGRQLALRRLRGGSVVLSFWTSCSEPSVEQLRQLRDALETGRVDRPHIFGIGDGEDPQQVSRLAEREQLPFPLIADPERSIARRYGVSCWPTTVQIGLDRSVEATDLGLVPGVSLCERQTLGDMGHLTNNVIL
ncbi:TlpA disulfide reductase family protein [Actinopolymorpha sp. NPDC004070]|uniref:peroxiredoxin family protein n=1 Tax=Actinopolymorpha sp. NPDC004070 TaxID=3154548 RepID=UPI0033BB4DEB